ncbi:MAG TPA: branched-chain amino acid ABC transporter permease [Rhodocyclaceae bacterium]|nr:branched-chain amino acid ABC transporter permease [Rhodocyclaceae bacterium]
MDSDIFLILLQDGITSGAIYALLALALVLVFSVTRIIFIPQGEFVAFGALSLAALQGGRLPATLWLLAGMGVVVAALESVRRWREADYDGFRSMLAWNLGYPALLTGLALLIDLKSLPMAGQIALTLAILVPLGPMVYRLAYQPLAESSVLVLLIASVAVHMILSGLGLVFFGAEGARTAPFSEGSLSLGSLSVGFQTLWVIACAGLFIAGLYLFFSRSLYGKALKATAVNQAGAKLMGISPVVAGKLTLLLAALIGSLSGILIGPVTTLYYDTGFLIGLKGFVAAIIGGLASFPLAALGALLVGLLESFSSFWASAFKDMLVFTLIIPVLLWRSLRNSHGENEE